MDMHAVTFAATELGQGHKAASLKFALWIAAMSPQKDVVLNGRAARVLAGYVSGGLPQDRELVYRALKRATVGIVYATMIDALYWVEQLDNFGALKAYEQVPTDHEGWIAWRDGLRAICKGHGLGYKVISFAGLIYAPLACDLVPVDRHVMARLGYKRVGSPQTRGGYTRVEEQVRCERDGAGYTHIPLALWHWLKWEEYRQETGASKAHGTGCESHARLSCRAYI
jgi:hypothetical protein